MPGRSARWPRPGRDVPPWSYAPITFNPTRFDLSKGFEFRVKWDGRYVAGVAAISPLRGQTDTVSHREGGEPSSLRHSPGIATYDPTVLTRGRTHDIEFEAWANRVWSVGLGAGTEVSHADFRNDIVIELLNEAGQLALAFKVYRCWPSEYIALADLDANASVVAIESLTLEREGWERDTSVAEPKEPGGKK